MALNSVGANELQDNSIPQAKLQDNSVGTNEIIDLNVTTGKVANDAIDDTKARLRNNQWLRGRNAANSADVNIVKVNASNVIEFGGSVTATPAVNSVGTDELQDNAVTTAKILDDSITLIKMADNSVDTPELVDGAVTTNKIENNAVTSQKVDAALRTSIREVSVAIASGASAAVPSSSVAFHSNNAVRLASNNTIITLQRSGVYFIVNTSGTDKTGCSIVFGGAGFSLGTLTNNQCRIVVAYDIYVFALPVQTLTPGT